MTFGTRALVLAAVGGMLLLSAPIAAEAAGQGPSAGNQNSVELRKDARPGSPQGLRVRGDARQQGEDDFDCTLHSGHDHCGSPQDKLKADCTAMGGGLSSNQQGGISCSVPDE